MVVDQSGQDRRSTEIDDLRASWNSRSYLRSMSDRDYSLALHNYADVVLHDVAASVDHVRSLDHVGARELS